MIDLIHIPFATVLSIAVIWTSAFSMSNTPGIRGYRNLGIFACYLSLIVFFFIAGWRSVLVTWAFFGLFGGVIYILWEVIQRVRTPAGEDKPSINLLNLIGGQIGWPIMIPEALEYTLAELGVLKPPQTDGNQLDTGAKREDVEGRS